ncbi:hypothetical protein HELRODRAFT_91624 [Helobdella robusta]|uniref:G-protein coupled receptors family 1 profile domain-containing protein n=1 Tax=Helobdella robusta TaxID=6412 RepID=T1G865_HELRO|nr:hypothetical protein HELRODRAFT_91624 [Helobdella robusta]ESO11227.1 hypothetical protein HELRODRAFT_91624 [Helobdella robusta]
MIQAPENETIDDSFDSHCIGPQIFEDSLLAQYIYGSFSPCICIITLVTNILVCVVLCEKSMRSPTNVLLVAMAISDTVTGLWPLPIYLAFYSTSRYNEYIPYEWCNTFFYLTDHLPTIFHTVSIWLTVCLAGQRYLFVCRPTVAKRFCTINKTLKTIAVVYLLSLAFHSLRMAEIMYHPIELSSRVDADANTTACFGTFASIVAFDVVTFYSVHYTVRTILVNLVPCVLLVLFNVVLIHAMNQAAKRRSQLLKQNMRMESKRLEEKNSTTMMLVVVVGIFLLVEIPLAIFLLILVINNSKLKPLISDASIETISLFLNFLILLSYPLNFFIYCLMSRQFRKSFKKLVMCDSYCKKFFGSLNCVNCRRNSYRETEQLKRNGSVKNASECYETATNVVELKSIKCSEKPSGLLTIEQNSVDVV